jgi:hypothetical protein
MKSHDQLPDQVFILRFWRESTDVVEENTGWRILIRNINTRRRDVVDDVQRAFAIVAANLSAAIVEHDKPKRSAVESTEANN